MKLQIKVPLLVIIILLVIGTIFGGMMVYFQRKASVDQFQHMAMTLSGAVQGSLEQGMLSGERKQTQEAMLRIKQEEMVSEIVLFSPTGMVAASGEESQVGRIDTDEAIRLTLQSGEVSMQTARQNGRSELWVITPVFNKPECQICHMPQNRVLGAIKVGLDATPVDEQARQQTLFIGILGGLTFVIIGGGLAFALNRTILSPLSRLTESAQRLSYGDYSARAKGDGNGDEIGMLAQTFNKMAESVELRTGELELSRQQLAELNIDLENKVEQRTNELSALNAIITTISQSLDLHKIINDALSKILAVMGIEAGMIHLLDEKVGYLVCLAHRGLAPEYAREITRLKLGQGVAGKAAQSGEPVLVNDVEASPEAIVMIGERGKFRGYIGLPVKLQNRVIGVLALASYIPDRFEPQTLHLLSAMGDALGIGVENARKAQRLEEANKIREQLLGKLISAQEEERRRIARELHDEASQSMAALAINLGSIAETLPARYRDVTQRLETLKEQAIRTAGGIRDLALELRPSALDELGLPLAIDWYVKDRLVKRGLDVKVEVSGPKAKLPPYTETMLFRVIQEALTNVVKHAQASNVSVQLQIGTSKVIVQVEDNGKGFDSEAALSRDSARRSLGLHGMAERVALLGGTLAIRSQPGQGTCVRVEVPLAKEEADG
ncbi:MAG: GAF domain-containing protein [Chloroflexi bacterium]|nr:GAF domain-containing protein [Chloroflexota bacterium]